MSSQGGVEMILTQKTLNINEYNRFVAAAANVVKFSSDSGPGLIPAAQ